MNNSIAERIFGVDIYSLTLSILQDFFRVEQVESSILEFKSFHDDGQEEKKINAISQSVCAFLNSEGGILIWGAPKEQKQQGSGRKISRGDLTPVTTFFEKDTLIRKITSLISPLSPDLKFKRIGIGSSGYCYIFEVSRSEFSPHQIDGRYLMRLDGSNAPAPHYYVEALMKRISFPKLSGHVELGTLVVGYEFIIIPCLVYINNLSHFINEKNLDISIIITNFKILRENDLPNDNDFTAGGQIKSSSAILHYSRPYHERIFIMAHRDSLTNDSKATLMLSFSGDSSPIINSIYSLTVATQTQPPYHTYRFETDVDNENVINQSKRFDKSDAERNKETSDIMVKHFDQNVNTFPLHTYITNRQGRK
jgi:hypothetical protein